MDAVADLAGEGSAAGVGVAAKIGVDEKDASLDAALAVLGEKLLDRNWRLSNLYYVTDKSGQRVRFVPNWAQLRLFDSLAHRNVDLKVRQLGVTTGYCILWLDACLFNRNLRVGIVAHTKDDAMIIFRDKIQFAYDNLPPEIRAAIFARKRDAHELLLNNGSSIRVGVTFRSGTVQVLHVTEYGYICQRQPQRADEIKTGAFQAVPADGIIVVESTAKGRAGHFYELCQGAQKGNDWRFRFLPWYCEPTYALSPERAIEYKHETEYLDKLEGLIGQELTAAQRQWWCGKHRELGGDIFAEYPSTAEEAFKASTEGAYYGSQMLEAWQEKRVTAVPVDRALLVDTKRGQQQIDDRVSARNMAVQTRDIWTPRIIAALVILGAFLGEGFALSHVIPAGSEVLAGRVLGTLDSALLAVLYYYFGGSAGSDRKTELLAGGQPAKDGA